MVLFPNLNLILNITLPWVICCVTVTLPWFSFHNFFLDSFIPVSLLSFTVTSHFLLLDCLFATPFPMRFPSWSQCSFSVASSCLSCIPLHYSFLILISIATWKTERSPPPLDTQCTIYSRTRFRESILLCLYKVSRIMFTFPMAKLSADCYGRKMITWLRYRIIIYLLVNIKTAST